MSSSLGSLAAADPYPTSLHPRGDCSDPSPLLEVGVSGMEGCVLILKGQGVVPKAGSPSSVPSQVVAGPHQNIPSPCHTPLPCHGWPMQIE